MTERMVGDILAEMRAGLQHRTLEEVQHERHSRVEETDPICHRCDEQHLHAPTCPACGAHRYATREGQWWFCCYCSTVFTGTAEEWDEPVKRQYREMYRAQREKFLRLYAERYNSVLEQEA